MSPRESHPQYALGECSVLSLRQLPSYIWIRTASSFTDYLSLSLTIHVIPKQEGFVYLDLKLTHVHFLISSIISKKQTLDKTATLSLSKYGTLCPFNHCVAGMCHCHREVHGKKRRTELLQGNTEKQSPARAFPCEAEQVIYIQLCTCGHHWHVPHFIYLWL